MRNGDLLSLNIILIIKCVINLLIHSFNPSLYSIHVRMQKNACFFNYFVLKCK